MTSIAFSLWMLAQGVLIHGLDGFIYMGDKDSYRVMGEGDTFTCDNRDQNVSTALGNALHSVATQPAYPSGYAVPERLVGAKWDVCNVYLQRDGGKVVATFEHNPSCSFEPPWDPECPKDVSTVVLSISNTLSLADLFLEDR